MDKEKTKQAIDKVFRDMAGAMSAGMAYVGTRTGLFRAMAGKGPMTLEQVVQASGLQRNWFLLTRLQRLINMTLSMKFMYGTMEIPTLPTCRLQTI